MNNVEELEKRVLAGEDITPEQFVIAQEREKAAARIAELRARREAELERQRIEYEAEQQRAQYEAEQQQLAQDAETRQRLADERLADIERRFTDGENDLASEDILELRNYLESELEKAQGDFEAAKGSSSQADYLSDLFARMRLKDECRAKSEAASQKIEKLKPLVSRTQKALIALPHHQKRSYFEFMKKRIAELESESLRLQEIAKRHPNFHESSEGREFKKIMDKLNGLRAELNRADHRDRSESGGMQAFQTGVKGLIKAVRRGEISLSEAEIFVRQLMQRCEIEAPTDQGDASLFWMGRLNDEGLPIGTTFGTTEDGRKPYRQLEQHFDPFDDIDLSLEESKELLATGAIDYWSAHSKPFDRHIEFQKAIEDIAKNGAPEIKVEGMRWWEKRTARNAAERLRF